MFWNCAAICGQEDAPNDLHVRACQSAPLMVESNHIRTNLKYDGVAIHIRSLKEYIDEDFKLYAILEKKYLKLCKHCGKAFTAPNPKTEYDTFSCKNQENVYKSRARTSSNVTITDEGITVKNVISDELSNEIVKGLQKSKK